MRSPPAPSSLSFPSPAYDERVRSVRPPGSATWSSGRMSPIVFDESDHVFRRSMSPRSHAAESARAASAAASSPSSGAQILRAVGWINLPEDEAAADLARSIRPGGSFLGRPTQATSAAPASSSFSAAGPPKIRTAAFEVERNGPCDLRNDHCDDEGGDAARVSVAVGAAVAAWRLAREAAVDDACSADRRWRRSEERRAAVGVEDAASGLLSSWDEWQGALDSAAAAAPPLQHSVPAALAVRTARDALSATLRASAAWLLEEARSAQARDDLDAERARREREAARKAEEARMAAAAQAAEERAAAAAAAASAAATTTTMTAAAVAVASPKSVSALPSTEAPAILGTAPATPTSSVSAAPDGRVRELRKLRLRYEKSVVLYEKVQALTDRLRDGARDQYAMCLRAIRPVLSSLPADNPGALASRATELVRVVRQAEAVNSELVLVCLHLYSNDLVKQATRQAVGKSTGTLYAFAALTYILMRHFSDLRDVLLAALFHYCPFLSGCMLDGARDLSVESHLLQLGFVKVAGAGPNGDSAFETKVQYLERMSAATRLYACILQSQLATAAAPGSGSPASNVLDLADAWRWLAAVLNQTPTFATPNLLFVFLQVCGAALLRRYGLQAAKLLQVLTEEYVPLMVRDPECERGALTQLELLLSVPLQAEPPALIFNAN
jgi:hypothetical protein